MSSVRYTPLSTKEDHVAIDFGSAFTYGSNEMSDNKYKSAFSYNRPKYRMDQFDVRHEVVEQSMFSVVCHYIFVVFCTLLIIVTFPVSAWFCFKVIPSYERIVIFRLGRLVSTKGPGMVFIYPCIDRWKRVDMRLKAFNVPPQQLIMNDGAVIEVGADVYYRITNIEESVTCIQDMNHSLRVLLQTSMVNHLIRKALPELEEEKVSVLRSIQDDCNKTASSWGVEISRMELSTVKVHKQPNEGGPNLNLPPGISQVFQQLTSMFLQPSNKGPASQGQCAEGLTTVSPFIPTPDGASGNAEIYTSLPTPRNLLTAVQTLLNETIVRSIQAVYQFDVSGDGGGVFYLDLKNGSGSAGEGVPPGGEPDVTLELNVLDMQDMFIGNTKPLQAYMSGRLRVSGDLSAAMRLEEFIKKVVDKIKSENVT